MRMSAGPKELQRAEDPPCLGVSGGVTKKSAQKPQLCFGTRSIPHKARAPVPRHLRHRQVSKARGQPPAPEQNLKRQEPLGNARVAASGRSALREVTQGCACEKGSSPGRNVMHTPIRTPGGHNRKKRTRESPTAGTSDLRAHAPICRKMATLPTLAEEPSATEVVHTPVAVSGDQVLLGGQEEALPAHRMHPSEIPSLTCTSGVPPTPFVLHRLTFDRGVLVIALALELHMQGHAIPYCLDFLWFLGRKMAYKSNSAHLIGSVVLSLSKPLSIIQHLHHLGLCSYPAISCVCMCTPAPVPLQGHHERQQACQLPSGVRLGARCTVAFWRPAQMLAATPPLWKTAASRHLPPVLRCTLPLSTYVPGIAAHSASAVRSRRRLEVTLWRWVGVGAA